MKAFFDTNVLIYALLDTGKRDRAIETMADGGMISVQVLNEFTNVARMKLKRSWPEIERALAVIDAHVSVVAPLTVQTHAMALSLARDHRVAFFDALIVAAAIEGDCDVLYSEDFQTGRTFGRMQIVNPFRSEPS